MNHTPKEKLTELLADIESDLLADAIAVDTPEKLAQYKKKQRKALPFYRRPTAVRLAAAAACLAVFVGLFSWLGGDGIAPSGVPIESAPMYQGGSETPEPLHPIPTVPFVDVAPWESVSITDLSIESVDMINYYAAVRFLSQQAGGKTTSAIKKAGYDVQLLSGAALPDTTTPPDIMPPAPPIDATEPPPQNTEGPPVPPSAEPTVPQPPVVDMEYYEIDPEQTFYVSKVYFFRIEVTGEEFLARKIGTGIVDVVVTNAIWDEYMITFKNGDRYYSCLTNGGAPGILLEFSTHKYIEGYYMVKNGRQENTYFYVSYGAQEQVQQFEEGDDKRTEYPVLGKTYIADVNAYFTIDELEEYFRTPANSSTF